HLLDPGALGALGHQLTHTGGGGDVAGGPAPQVGLHRRGRGQGGAGDVVDHLGGDVLVGTEDRQAGTLGGAPHLLADAGVPADATVPLVLGARAHGSSLVPR